MSNPFFEKPILNSPYEYPSHHWELDDTGQPTQKVIDRRREASFITPIPKPRKCKKQADQPSLFVNELSTQEQEYDHTALINAVRREVEKWRRIPNPNHWRVTPETARLLQHWRHQKFAGSCCPIFLKGSRHWTGWGSMGRTSNNLSIYFHSFL